MAITLFNLFVFIFSVVSFVGAQYDYFQMVQQWPPATCSGAGVRCRRPIPNLFTIHGLWPSRNNSRVPIINCPGPPFNVTQIASLRPQLNRYWRDVKRWNYTWFWGHEWDTHGTCSDPPFDQLQYFQTTLNIRTNPKYDLLAILNAAGLGPTATTVRSYTAIAGAIQTATGMIPGLRCNTNALTNGSQLYEIILCFDPNGVTLIDCTASAGSNCPNHFAWLDRYPLSLDAAVAELKDSLVYHVSLYKLLFTFATLCTAFALAFWKIFSRGGSSKKD